MSTCGVKEAGILLEEAGYAVSIPSSIGAHSVNHSEN